MSEISFFFESNDKGGYVDVLANSKLVLGNIVSQNAGSTNPGIYYQVGGGGLNGAFASALGTQATDVNRALQAAYDTKFGTGSWSRDSGNPPSPLPLTSLLVPVTASAHVGNYCVGMMYSVGPMLTSAGLTPTESALYTKIYADAATEIAQSATTIDGFRITHYSDPTSGFEISLVEDANFDFPLTSEPETDVTSSVLSVSRP